MSDSSVTTALEQAMPASAGTFAFPLSYPQRRLWFVYQLEQESRSYNIPVSLRLSGKLDVDCLRRSFEEIIRRHESLRTTFSLKEGEPVQVVHPPHPVKLPIIDLSLFDPAEREQMALQLRREYIDQRFVLERGPLLRFRLLRHSDTEYEVHLVLHHIISDGWSEGLLMRELQALYVAYRSGRPSPLPELKIQYADYSLWQHEWLAGEVLQEQLEYWRNKLKGAPVVEIPRDYPRPQKTSYRGEMVRFRFSRKLTEAIKDLARNQNVTTFMVLLGAYKLLLRKYSGQTDICVGTVVANRGQRETEDLIGFFVNTLVLRTDLSGRITFSGLLRRIQATTVEAYAHQSVPFEKIVEEVNPERYAGGTPFIQAGLAFQNVPADDSSKFGDLEISAIRNDHNYSLIDFGISLSEDPNGMDGILMYSTDLFTRRRMERLIEHFQEVLESVTADPSRSTDDVVVFSREERETLVDEWNRTANSIDPAPVHRLFERQAAEGPDSIAVIHNNSRVSYRQLNERVNQVAHYLRSLGVGPETRVGICLDRSPEMLAAVLGVLKGGGAYVPLDPLHPVDRLRFVSEDSQLSVVLTTANYANKLFTGVQAVAMDSCDELSRQSRANPAPVGHPENLAYIIYTSGSTGTPKGVLIAHGGLTNAIQAGIDILAVNRSTRLSQLASLTFDASAAEIFIPLCAGGSLCIIGSEKLLSGEQFVGTLNQESIDMLGGVPSLLTMLSPEYLPSLRTVIVGGESCPPDVAASWLKSKKLFNAYAPTEATIFSTLVECRLERCKGALPLGRPVANVRMYILDDSLHPVPFGAVGEICIGGLGIARGYWHRTALTAERFVPDPFADQAGARLYRTGDLARFRPDGDMEFLGRLDDQVKLRGYRIELGEIETALLQLSEVSQCTVAVRTDDGGNKQLVAYVVPRYGEQIETSKLKSKLRIKVPEYMVPAAIVPMAALPVTPNGKVDRHALPAPQFVTEETYTAPRTPLEDILARIWMDVLGVERVGVHDNFFDLGGHSLLATQITSRLRAAGIEIPLAALFEEPTVARLALKAQSGSSDNMALIPPPLHPRDRSLPAPLSFSQQRLWFLNQLDAGSRSNNVPLVLRITGELDPVAFEAAMRESIRRHEVLRTIFPSVDGVPYQKVAPDTAFSVERSDLTHLPPEERESRMRTLAAEYATRPFELEKTIATRAVLFALDTYEHVFCMTVHHISFDGESLQILMEELAALYKQFAAGQVPVMPELPIQYADAAAWEREWLQGEVLEAHLKYWRDTLDGCTQRLILPTNFPRPQVWSAKGAKHEIEIPREVARGLEELGRRAAVTEFMMVLALVDIWLAYFSGQNDILVGSPVSNRLQLETEPLIGFFINTLVFRVQIQPKMRFLDLLNVARRNALRSYAYQALPFDKLVDDLQVERNPSYNPLFQVMLNYVKGAEKDLQIGGLTLQPVSLGAVQASFDLHLGAYPTAKGIDCVCTYAADLFQPSTIEGMMAVFKELARIVSSRPECTVEELTATLRQFEYQRTIDSKRERAEQQLSGLHRARRRVATAMDKA